MCSLTPFHLGVPGHVHRGGRQVLPGRAGVGPRPSTLHWGHLPGSQARKVSWRLQHKTPFTHATPTDYWQCSYGCVSFSWCLEPGLPFTESPCLTTWNLKSDCTATCEELHLNPNKYMVTSCKGNLKKWGRGMRCKSIRKWWYVVRRWWERDWEWEGCPLIILGYWIWRMVMNLFFACLYKFSCYSIYVAIKEKILNNVPSLMFVTRTVRWPQCFHIFAITVEKF